MGSTDFERLRKVLDYLKNEGLSYNVTDFAGKIGKTRSFVSEVKNGNRSLSSRFADSVEEAFPMISGHWLLTGEGSMLKEERPKMPKGMKEVEILGKVEDLYIPVPFLDMGVQAGWLQDFRSDEPRSEDELNFRYVSSEFRNGTYIVAAVRGDSMDDGTKRSISDGDEVLLQLVDDFAWNGLAILNNLYVIVTQDGTVLKQITKLERGEEGYIRCHSFNSLYSDYDVDLSEVRWFFKVCRVVSRRISI